MTTLPPRWLNQFCWFLSGSVLFLIFAGALVTSTGSGLAVPDWPLSYGRLMPPMIGGIFYEHGHRMIAAAIGFLTVFLALFMSIKESRPWVKKLSWLALGLVIFQGLLGGLTVLLRLPPAISILHACAAQTFLCLVVALAVWTSRSWFNKVEAYPPKKTDIPVRQLTLSLFVVCYLQLILGAVLRHTGWALIPHITGAFLVVALGVWTKKAIVKQLPGSIKLNQLSRFLVLAIVIQMALGLSTYFILGYEFDVIPIPFYATFLQSFHVVMGAFVLALTVPLFILTAHIKPVERSQPSKTKLADYFELTKPGITMTAAISALAGFVLGSKGSVNLLQLFHTSVGTLLIAAGAGTLNMLIEIDTDSQMKRTKKRPLPSGRLKPGEALFLGALLSVVAILYLSWAVNLLTAFIAGLTLSVYLYIYTPLKKVTSFCTTVGAVAGALPPVIGWTAATNNLGLGAWVLFGILFFWQFPHFFSLAWLYKDDYAQAGLHMLPRVHDNGMMTSLSTVVNSVALLVVSLMPTLMGLTGKVYFVTALILGGWLVVGSVFFFRDRSIAQARKLFFSSLAYVPLLVIVMVLNQFPWLP